MMATITTKMAAANISTSVSVVWSSPACGFPALRSPTVRLPLTPPPYGDVEAATLMPNGPPPRWAGALMQVALQRVHTWHKAVWLAGMIEPR
jgi:hypothetical protein